MFVIQPLLVSLWLGITFLLGPPWLFPNDELPAGPVGKTALKQAEPNLLWSTISDRMSIVDRDPNATKLGRQILVEYPHSAWGSKDSGAQFMVKLDPATEYRCDYFVKFGESFDFVKGGKLPGLAGGEATAGNKRPTGDGWTARYMWRAGGDAVLYFCLLYTSDAADE